MGTLSYKIYMQHACLGATDRLSNSVSVRNVFLGGERGAQILRSSRSEVAL